MTRQQKKTLKMALSYLVIVLIGCLLSLGAKLRFNRLNGVTAGPACRAAPMSHA